jgi:hypothetical protein
LPEYFKRDAVLSSRRTFSSNNRTISGFESLDARTRYFAAQISACSIIIAALLLVVVTMRDLPSAEEGAVDPVGR